MRGAAGPRPAMAPPAAFIPPALLLFILGPAAPKEGENRRDPKPNFSFFSFFPPPPKNFLLFLNNFSLFLPPPPKPPSKPPTPIFYCFSLFMGPQRSSAPLCPRAPSVWGFGGQLWGGGRREGGQKATL